MWLGWHNLEEMAATVAGKPWRLSASIVVLAPRAAVPVNGRGAARAGVPIATGHAMGAGAKASSRDGMAVKRADYKICFVKRTSGASFMPDQMVSCMSLMS